MSLFQAFILGIVQGATEFLPISSSAHLVIVPAFLGWAIDSEMVFVFDVLVQVGTIVAVVIYFWRDLWRISVAVLRGLAQRAPLGSPDARLGWLIVLALVPVVVIGPLFKDFLESLFESPRAAGAFLLVTAALLTLAESVGRQGQRDINDIGWLDALIIGVFQTISIFPGVSRSGATIAGGMFRGLDRKSAARFTFLLAVPTMIGAGVLATIDLFAIDAPARMLPVIGVGFVTAAVVGLLSIHWLLRFLTHHSLYWFAGYCTIVGLLALIFS